MPSTPDQLRTGTTLRHDMSKRLLVIVEGYAADRTLLKVASYDSGEQPHYLAVRGALRFHTAVLPAPNPVPDAPPEWLSAAA